MIYLSSISSHKKNDDTSPIPYVKANLEAKYPLSSLLYVHPQTEKGSVLHYALEVKWISYTRILGSVSA